MQTKIQMLCYNHNITGQKSTVYVEDVIWYVVGEEMPPTKAAFMYLLIYLLPAQPI